MFGLALRPVVETINSDVRVPTLPPDVLVLTLCKNKLRLTVIIRENETCVKHFVAD
jgi:hypothetical protein